MADSYSDASPQKMKYFTIEELCQSTTATRLNIDNTPDEEAIINLTALVDNILDPLRERFGQPIMVTSGYRCKILNRAVGGAPGSQHERGEAADITASNAADNAILYDIILNELLFDQLIWEKGNDRFPAWVHVSFSQHPRYSVLRIY